MTNIDRLTLTVAEAAEILGVSRSTIYRLIQRGVLPAVAFGRRRLISRAAITALLEFDPTVLGSLRVSEISRDCAGERSRGCSSFN